MELTKKQALIITKELWTWLSEHPGEYKSEWPGWLTYGRMLEECACCEYARDSSCANKCPLFGYAWNFSCWTEGEVYSNWCHAREVYTRDRIREERAALIIVDACERALEDLEKEEVNEE